VDKKVIEDELVKKIKSAFATMPPPNEDNIVIVPNNYESFMVANLLKGKHWQDLSEATIYEIRLNLPRLTPEAFRFYLPAYLIWSLKGENGGEILEYVVFNLNPQEDNAKKKEFIDKVKYFTSQQKEAIKAYVKYYFEMGSYKSKRDERLWQFWENYD
jgi:hypothetical protein